MSTSQEQRKSGSLSIRASMLLQSKALVRKFRAKNDVPAWFRGISWFQLAAADEVQNAIRDDMQQGSLFRLQRRLSDIGLNPLPPKKLLRKTMRLSRGNDLAFLWFIMEAFYRTDKTGLTYSVNEQLLMSCIAHLDMVCTLRELDRILPPPNPSKKDLERQKAAEKQSRNRAERRAEKRKMNENRKKENTLPYFDRLVRRRFLRSTLHSKVPSSRAGIDLYGNYRDPTYEVPNEPTRWFSNYALNPVNRITNRLIQNEIDSIFGNVKTAESRRVTSDLLNRQLSVLFRALEYSPSEPLKDFHSLCKVHEEEKKRKEVEEARRLVEQKKKCMQAIDVDGQQAKKRRADRILKQLEEDVDTYRVRYCDNWDKSKTRVLLLQGRHLTEHMVTDSESKSCHNLSMMHAAQAVKVLTYSGSCTLDYRLEAGEEAGEKAGEEAAAESVEIPLCETMSAPQLLCTTNVPIMPPESPRRRLSKTSRPEDESINFEHPDNSTPPSSQMFFNKPTANRPYFFDYTKIFQFKYPDHDIEHLQTVCMKTLDAKQSNVKTTKDGTLDLGPLVDKQAEKTWDENVEQFEDVLRKTGHRVDEVFPGIPKRSHYDCADKQLMNDLLKAALDQMAENPKFVLASMPDAHKLPLLREWTYSRYGKKYSHAELVKLGRTSIKVFQALRMLPFRVRLPDGGDLGPNLNLDYHCRNYMIKKSEMLKKEFYGRYDDEIMRIAREFWFAMRPHLYPKQPPKTTYFSYMPPHVLAIHHFRPWKPSEYMDAKSAWEDKRRENLKYYK